MYGLTYDIWKEIIGEIVLAHDTLFLAMNQAADELQITSALISELKSKRELAIANETWEFRLMIDFVEDEINGFLVFLAAIEQTEMFEQIKANAISDHGFSMEEAEIFDQEHGLDMKEEILEEMEESYGVRAEVREDAIVYELVVFDSQDIDDSRNYDQTWQGDADN